MKILFLILGLATAAAVPGSMLLPADPVRTADAGCLADC